MRERTEPYWEADSNDYMTVRDLWEWAVRYGLEDFTIKILYRDDIEGITECDLTADLVNDTIEI